MKKLMKRHAVKSDTNVVKANKAIMRLARKQKRGVAAVKHFNFGPGTGHLSRGIDDILYGD